MTIKGYHLFRLLYVNYRKVIDAELSLVWLGTGLQHLQPDSRKLHTAGLDSIVIQHQGLCYDTKLYATTLRSMPLIAKATPGTPYQTHRLHTSKSTNYTH